MSRLARNTVDRAVPVLGIANVMPRMKPISVPATAYALD
jgi:hypothetical protein